MMKFQFTPIDANSDKYYCGITCDNAYLIDINEVEAGKLYINELTPGETTIEWVELYPDYQGKHLFRGVLAAIKQKEQKKLTFHCDNDLKDMYIHLGARFLEYDDFAEQNYFEM